MWSVLCLSNEMLVSHEPSGVEYIYKIQYLDWQILWGLIPHKRNEKFCGFEYDDVKGQFVLKTCWKKYDS